MPAENVEIQSMYDISEIILNRNVTIRIPKLIHKMCAITIRSHKSQSFSQLYAITYAFKPTT